MIWKFENIFMLMQAKQTVTNKECFKDQTSYFTEKFTKFATNVIIVGEII